MKRLVLILFLCLLPALLYAQMQGSHAGVTGASAGGECSGYLICQNFETTSTTNCPTTTGTDSAAEDNLETWACTGNANGSSIDPNDTTATVLRGSQQLKMYAGTSGQANWTSPAFTAQSEIYGHMLVQIPATISAGLGMISMRSGTTEKMSVSWGSGTDVLVTSCGGTNNQFTDQIITSSTPYHIWWHYKAATDGGSPGNAQCSVEITALATKSPICTGTCLATNHTYSDDGGINPTYAVWTQGTSTTTVDHFTLLFGQAKTLYFDQIIVSSSPIASVP